MRKPIVLSPTDPVREIARVFNTPLVIRKDLSALPLSQFAAAVWFYRYFEDRYPEFEHHRFTWSVVCTLATLGSEWCHNLAHAFVANQINKPIDAIRIQFGMPLLVYFDPNDPEIRPREHILRALGGPVFNASTIIPLLLLRNAVGEGTPRHFLVSLALKTNLFLLAASLTPHPSLDGGPLLKWSLVDAGRSEDDAENTVKQVNGFAAAVFLVLSMISYRRRRKLVATLLGLLGISSLAIALGWLDEAY